MKQKLTIRYTGKLDTDLDARIAGLLEHLNPPFEWLGQGMDIKREVRDISFEREKE